MHFQSIFLLLPLLAAVKGAPTADTLTAEELARFEARAETPGPVGSVAASDIEKRAQTHLYACQNPNFLGPCQNFDVDFGTCYNWVGTWNDNVGSLGPDVGVTCCAYVNWGCSGGTPLCFQNPGLANIGSLNDKLSSYNCFKNN